ncbi:hypothetical protein Hanom_Chr08g00728861 [Helianthus anomalus]
MNTAKTIRPTHDCLMRRGNLTLTCVLGKADVRRVSCVSSAGFLLGTLRTKAAWSHVAAQACDTSTAPEPVLS